MVNPLIKIVSPPFVLTVPLRFSGAMVNSIARVKEFMLAQKRCFKNEETT
jgi:hypothetical protein